MEKFIEWIDSESYISELDWVGVDYIQIVDRFKAVYSLDVPLLTLVYAVPFFMADYLDCESCPLEERHFIEFYAWIHKLNNSF